jgi:hypothetical protein
MAENTVTTKGNGDNLRQRIKLMNLEIIFLRQNVQFFELLAAERKLKAKRLGLRANFYEKLYQQERYKQEQWQQAKQDKEPDPWL